MLDTRGVILTWVGEGHSGVVVMMLCQKCESAGIKTVMLNSEMALTPDDPGFVHLVSEADAIVSTGNYEMKVDLPPVDQGATDDHIAAGANCCDLPQPIATNTTTPSWQREFNSPTVSTNFLVRRI